LQASQPSPLFSSEACPTGQTQFRSPDQPEAQDLLQCDGEQAIESKFQQQIPGSGDLNKLQDALQSAQPCLPGRRVAVKRFSIASVTITLNGKPLRLEYARSCASTSRGILNVAGTNGSPTGIARSSARAPCRYRYACCSEM